LTGWLVGWLVGGKVGGLLGAMIDSDEVVMPGSSANAAQW